MKSLGLTFILMVLVTTYLVQNDIDCFKQAQQATYKGHYQELQRGYLSRYQIKSFLFTIRSMDDQIQEQLQGLVQIHAYARDLSQRKRIQLNWLGSPSKIDAIYAKTLNVEQQQYSRDKSTSILSKIESIKVIGQQFFLKIDFILSKMFNLLPEVNGQMMNRRILSRYEYNVGDGKLDISGERNNDILHLGSDIQRADFIFQINPSQYDSLQIIFKDGNKYGKNAFITLRYFYDDDRKIIFPMDVSRITFEDSNDVIDLSQTLEVYSFGQYIYGSDIDDIFSIPESISTYKEIIEVSNGINSKNDIIKMGSGIKKSDLTLHRGNIYENHLYIIFLDNNKYGQAELCIVNFFTDSGYLQSPIKIEKIIFEDNDDIIDLTQPLDLRLVYNNNKGTAKSDNYIVPNYISTYLEIREIDNGVDSRNDTIIMEEGILRKNINYYRGSSYQQHLYIDFTPNSQFGEARICIIYFFYNQKELSIYQPQKIEQIILADGYKIDLSEIISSDPLQFKETLMPFEVLLVVGHFFEISLDLECFKNIGEENIQYTFSKYQTSDPEIPSWLSFNQETVMLSGTPTLEENLNFKITGTNTDTSKSIEQQIILKCTINDPPTLIQASDTIEISYANKVDYSVVNNFEDQENDKLSYTAHMKDELLLVEWLQINSKTGQLISQSLNEEKIGTYTVVIKASDQYAESDPFELIIEVKNKKPHLKNLNKEKKIITLQHSRSLSYRFNDIFIDEEGDTLEYKVQMKNEDDLIDWLSIDSESEKLKNTQQLKVGTYQLLIIANDSVQDSDPFEVEINVFNKQPKIIKEIDQEQLDLHYDSDINIDLSQYFEDEDGDILSYEFQIDNSVGLPNWLTFYDDTPKQSLKNDLIIPPGRYNLIIKAFDQADYSNSFLFIFSVTNSKPYPVEEALFFQFHHAEEENFQNFQVYCSDYFIDSESNTLTYTAQMEDGSELTNFDFDDQTGLLSIKQIFLGNINLQVIAHDKFSSSQPFTVQIEIKNQAPIISSTLTNFSIIEFSHNGPIIFSISEHFSDPDSDKIEYDVQFMDDQDWIKSLIYNNGSFEVNNTIPLGKQNMSIRATDGLEYSPPLHLTFYSKNQLPKYIGLSKEKEYQLFQYNDKISIDISHYFTDDDKDELSYFLTKQNEKLPEWLKFNQQGVFEGEAKEQGQYLFYVQASDSYGFSKVEKVKLKIEKIEDKPPVLAIVILSLLLTAVILLLCFCIYYICKQRKQIKELSEKMLAQAQSIRQEAYSEGYNKGYREAEQKYYQVVNQAGTSIVQQQQTVTNNQNQSYNKQELNQNQIVNNYHIILQQQDNKE